MYDFKQYFYTTKFKYVRVKIIILCFILSGLNGIKAQDTFSILAFDSITGEVGAAGASCVDLFQFTGYTNHFIAELFPGEGAIATQASYLPINQINARNQFLAGDSPSQLINWLNANDAQSATSAQTRQYGVVRMNKGYPMAAAFTGTACLDYKNHITGPNYSIQGNILLGQKVLDSMEIRFNREKGDLACKLMAAMQGANMVGADSRCAANGSSSLFAFLKVTLPTDTFAFPYFLVSLKTPNNAGIEPIDSLQILFNAKKSCPVNLVGITKETAASNDLKVFPNPAKNLLTIKIPVNQTQSHCLIKNVLGEVQFDAIVEKEIHLNTTLWERGIYFIEVNTSKNRFISKLVLN